jgi:catechol 2,3-dioxygenase-like lactoylglutathione lyase family enzyme
MASLPLRGLVPIAHVADVARSIEFYRRLGFEARNSLNNDDDQLVWASLQNGKAHLMLSRSARPMNPGEQYVLFYLYAANVAAYRAELAARGITVGPLTYPFYMPEGEFRIDDPDGYCLLVGQSDEA